MTSRRRADRHRHRVARARRRRSWVIELLAALAVAASLVAVVALARPSAERESPPDPSAVTVVAGEGGALPQRSGMRNPEQAGAEGGGPVAGRHAGARGGDAEPRYEPTGEIVTVGGTAPASGPAPVRTFSVGVEKGLPIDARGFAARVSDVLASPRSWGGAGDFSVQRVASESASFRVVLASPQTTDAICAPLQTNGIFSCAEGTTAVLNYMRWMRGAAAYGEDLASYRVYMINHEVGHTLGHGHAVCPEAGAPAPVMMQQTKGVGACEPNPWPRPYEG